MLMQTITPFLWFNDQAEAAARYYTSVFKDSSFGSIVPGPDGNPMVVTFFLNGQNFVALNGGPTYEMTPAISFVIQCDTQDEVDYLWDKLSDGGKEMQCGWLTDKFGLTWQIIPSIFPALMADPNRNKAGAVAAAMMGMVKLDSAALQEAFDSVD